MTWGILFVFFGLSLIPGAILIPFRERKENSSPEIQVDPSPSVRITTFDGWVALELVNRSDVKVWIEEANLVIAGLDASVQTFLATGGQIHKIRQAVVPGERLSVSLAGSLYEAAGRPQGRYSFVLRGTVQYRIGEDCAQANIRPHRIEMAALSVLRVRRLRRERTPAQTHDDQRIPSGFLAQISPSKETAMAKSVGR
jgi:hypothetical protein